MLVSGLTRERFRRLKKDQLITLAEGEEVELEKDMTKPAIAACLIKVLGLEEMWSEQDREKDIALQRQERELKRWDKEKERELQRLDKEKERAHVEKLARLEVEKAIVMGRKAEQTFDINRARSFIPLCDERAVDVFFEMIEKVVMESEWPEEKWPLLVQSVLTGKAQRAVAALDSLVGLEYESLRKAALEAYDRVPEAYR